MMILLINITKRTYDRTIYTTVDLTIKINNIVEVYFFKQIDIKFTQNLNAIHIDLSVAHNKFNFESLNAL